MDKERIGKKGVRGARARARVCDWARIKILLITYLK